jgi:N-acetylneuraminic acid mutarotase
VSIEAVLKESMKSVARIKSPDAEGSGFAFAAREADTLFVTNAHVVEGATEVTLVTADGKSRKGSVMARDEDVDLAIVKVSDTGVAPALILGDANAQHVGNLLYVIGFPLGQNLAGDATVTRGILSGRRQMEGINYVQTDAEINPGNSGGPVLDSSGKVVGIATSSRNQDNVQGINFAIPADVIEYNYNRLLVAASDRLPTPTAAWQVLPTLNDPDPRTFHVTVWTDREMLVWGGTDGEALVKAGARYNPKTNAWKDLPTKDQPDPRIGAMTVWTGKEMIVWGGFGVSKDNKEIDFSDGGRFDPASDTWKPLPKSVLTGRGYAQAVWTGTEAIVWGGSHGSKDKTGCETDGARFNPTTNLWRSIATKGAPSARTNPSVVWTGQELIVWGGVSCDPLNPGYLDTGARYDPATDVWHPMSHSGALLGRALSTAIWTGHDVLIWGGTWGAGDLGDGRRYDPVSDTWKPLSSDGAPTPRRSALAISTGSEMIVWGGGHVGGVDSKTGKATWTYLNDGARFDYAAQRWSPLPWLEAPRGRVYSSVVWTGEDMIIWGGYGNKLGSMKQSQVYMSTGSLLHVTPMK